MKQNKHKEPMKETTKDDSSDEKKAKQPQASAPPNPGNSTKDRSKEDEQAQKGHA